MEHGEQTVSYFIYARKSTESEDRQVQSIDDQLSHIRRLTSDRGLRVVDTLTEAKSAKTPESRPVYQDMIRRIQNGEAQGILCWQLNRLSRNPVDSGTLSWMLQRSVIRSIVTPEREYRPEDNVLLFSVEAGMANQYILDLSRNVKRGLQGKLARGDLTGLAPIGYLNDRLDTRVVVDPERYPLVRQAWDLMLTGAYSVPQVLQKLNEDWGYRTPKRRASGGRPVAINTLYRVFRNPFYAGLLRIRGREYTGRHQSMVTLEEFDRVQQILGDRGRSRTKEQQFTFSRLLRCGECGCLVTAETKRKRLQNTGQVAEYTYYHCTLRRLNVRCSQRSYVREDDLIDGLTEELARLSIRPEFREKAMELVGRYAKLELESTAAVAETQEQAAEKIERQMERLAEMCYSDLLTPEEYERERVKLQNRLTRTRQDQSQRLENGAQLIRLEEASHGLVGLAERFREASAEQKRVILVAVSSNCVLLNGKPQITARPWIERLHSLRHALESQTRFEPHFSSLDKGKADLYGSAMSTWLARWDDIRNFGDFPGGNNVADEGSEQNVA
jgi:site-specific DNA recombinase